jgi:predicted ATPase/DNA-binding SARP family transcriptional activator
VDLGSVEPAAFAALASRCRPVLGAASRHRRASSRRQYAPPVRVRVLGSIELETTRGEPIPLPGAKTRGLIAVLALEAGSSIPMQRLIDALWGDQEVSGPNVVQVAVSKLRRTLADAGESERITTQPSGYRLEIERNDVDALRFEALLDQARSQANDPATLAAALGGALALWRGTALADVPTTDVTDALRTRLDELRQGAIEDLVDAELTLGHHRRLAADLEALVAAEPLRERRWGQLMRALYGSGQQAEALRAYQRARQVLVEQMGVEPSPELRRLEAAVLAQDETVLGAGAHGQPSTAPIGATFRRRGNVRHPVGSCVGRKDELDRVLGLVERHRLITLTGTGGVGKTRLALELAVRLMPDVPDGVWWIDLTAARDGKDALAALQRALQVEPGGTADVAAGLVELATVLGDGVAVLVFDNCEQLRGSIESIVAELLGRCGGIRVVATSRAALDVRGEVLFAVLPLELTAAMTLFEERVEGLGADVSGATAAIARICERLDRLPLALELAAARVRHLSLDDILERLTDRFEVLRDHSGAAPTHQSDLRAVADWSYDLLDDDERVVFERLSVFAGGATLAAGRTVCAGNGVDPDDVEPLLARLVDRSLIYLDRTGAQTRYRMLQTLYDYAGERLAERGDVDDARLAHARWVRGLALTVEFGARTTGATIAVVQDENVAVRDAIAWSIGSDPLLALDICTKLGAFWFGTMRVSTGWDLLAAALDAAGDDDPGLRSAALVWAIVFSTMVHDLETANRLADEASRFEQQIGDPKNLGLLSFARALAAGYRGDANPRQWVDDARRHFAASSSPVALGHASFADGATRLVTGDLDGAHAALREAADVFRREHDHLGLILAVSRLGELAWRRQDIDQFADLHAELLGLGHESRSPGVITGATARLALARLAQGSIDEARSLADDALSSTGESFMAVINGYAFKAAGLVNLALGHVDEGRSQLRMAIEAFERGAGGIGTGLAAMCWIDISRSCAETGPAEQARDAAETAVELARAAGDPWVLAQADAQLASTTTSDA